MKRAKIIAVILVSLAISLVIPITFSLTKGKDSKKQVEHDYTSYISTNKEELSKSISGKKIDIIDNDIYIGENTKQIENGYFDICIGINNGIKFVKFNKLFKEEKLNIDNVCDINYLNDVFNITQKVFNIKLLQLDKDKVIKHIESEYKKLRKTISLVDNSENVISVNNYDFITSVKDNILHLSIKLRGDNI